MNAHWTYLAINLLSVAVPFGYSFTARSGFSRRFPAAFAALLLVAVPMIAWDAVFTARGVWGFNPAYHLGASFFGLPLEEMLFFLCIPFACLFVYDTVRKFPRLALPEKPARVAAGLLAAVLAVLPALYADRAYTTVCFTLAAALLAALAAGYPRGRVGSFATAYLFQLVPFFLVNGLLTALPVVVYDDAENLGLRLGTIPVEDAAYALILLAATVMLFERFLRFENGERKAP
jgi:lycopene cyclase domain-containing protein